MSSPRTWNEPETASLRSTETGEPLAAPASFPPAAQAVPGCSPALTEPIPPFEVIDVIAVDEVKSGEGERRPHRPLPLWVRIGVFLVGWLLVLIGIAGLVLPGIQGVFTILVGAALLSLVSEIAYELLRKCLHRWPRAWDRVERFRDRAHEKLHGWFHRETDSRE